MNKKYLEQLNGLVKGTLMESLGIRFTEASTECVCGEMPVDERTRQPFGVLHGGAFMALAETLGSAGTMIGVNSNTHQVFGIEMKGNYVRSIKSGTVYGKATPVHKGKSTELWNVDMTDADGNLLATCRITNLIVEKNSMSKFEDIFNLCVAKNFSIAAFQFPGENQYQYIIQLSGPRRISESDDVTTLNGFVFAPFANQGPFPSLLISPDLVKNKTVSEHTILQTLIEAEPADISNYPNEETYQATKEEYTENVDEIRRRIRNGEFQKAIISRTLVEKRNGSLKTTDLFLRLCNLYHFSFISLVYIPGYATWIGATPELLISRRNKNITLVSLAGTQAKPHDNLNVTWNEKDIIEQRIVTDYLGSLLKEFNIDEFQQKGPETAQAGEIVHLKTTFTLDESKMNGHAGEFIHKLHPTPAVWGQPKSEALDVIKQLEKYNREYYAGYLGPVNMNGNIDLFVNLRTMKILNDKLMIYVGSGITADSDPQKEWEETCMKARTLLSVINQ